MEAWLKIFIGIMVFFIIIIIRKVFINTPYIKRIDEEDRLNRLALEKKQQDKEGLVDKTPATDSGRSKFLKDLDEWEKKNENEGKK